MFRAMTFYEMLFALCTSCIVLFFIIWVIWLTVKVMQLNWDAVYLPKTKTDNAPPPKYD